MWLLNKISCEIQILNEKVGKLMIENGKLEKENKKLNIIIENTKIEQNSDRKHIEELEEENKKLKLIQETNEKQIKNDIKERDELREENKKLKAELSKYKKQYEHSMGFSDFGGYDGDEHIVKDENTYRDLDL